jgi:hypothetical protein
MKLPENPSPFERDMISLLKERSREDLERIVFDMMWDLFGDVDENCKDVLVSARDPDRIDHVNLLRELRAEFWPELYPDGHIEADE